MAKKPARTIDLNADVGEAVDEDGIARERALLALVTSANIACGGHAGDEDSMAATVAAALEDGVRVGAHPSYPDREGFGRVPLQMERADLDGFNLLPCPPTRGIEDICRLLIPELQRRGMFRRSYEGGELTLRERYLGAGHRAYGE